MQDAELVAAAALIHSASVRGEAIEDIKRWTENEIRFRNAVRSNERTHFLRGEGEIITAEECKHGIYRTYEGDSYCSMCAQPMDEAIHGTAIE